MISQDIRTIEDLNMVTPSALEEVRSSIDVRSTLLWQWEKDGKRTGFTKAQYEEKLRERKPEVCATCNGTGIFTPGIRSVGVIHPSSAHKCRLRLYHDVTGDLQPYGETPYEMEITFAIGHTIHKMIQDTLGHAYDDAFEAEVQVNLPEALIWNGHADFVLDLGYTRVLGEIKTMGEEEFQKLKRPKEDHILQASLYAKALDLPFLVFLYVSKGKGHQIKQFIVTYDEKVYENWFYTKLLPVDEALATGKMPVADATEYECRQCPYNRSCPQRIERRDRFRTG